MKRWIVLILWPVLCCTAADLAALAEHQRPDPFGGVVEEDRVAGSGPVKSLTLETARAGYVSCHLVVKLEQPGEYRLSVAPFSPGIKTELYREWFHFVPPVKRYYPDALIPVKASYSSRIPEPDNQVRGQTAQAFWLDVWVPLDTQPGTYRSKVTLVSGGKTRTLPLILKVLAAAVPAEDAVAIDHNSYSAGWLADHYPDLSKRLGSRFFESDEFFQLIHSLHRIFYEHRGVFHQLGYGHAGGVDATFAPDLEGSGKRKRIASWSLYDRHYGPLLDGSAFTGTRRGPRPIPFVYLPVNPEWPASYLNWGEPGYEAEFVNVLSAMESHFREKGWSRTRFELFFNHKKRYKGFSWDGDEPRSEIDFPFFAEYARLLKKAVPADSPVQFVFRADASWMMERQFKSLAGIVNFWVCGNALFSWYDYAPRMLKERGDIVWVYGGTPPVTEASSHITLNVLRPWLWGVDGYVRWLTTSPGPDPWFHFQGGEEALIYPGSRFGIDAPLASVRLKLQRNAVQDVTLLDSFRKTKTIEALRSAAARRFNDTDLKEWWTPRPALADRPMEEWTNANTNDAASTNPKFSTALDAAAWQRVRTYVLELAREAQ